MPAFVRISAKVVVGSLHWKMCLPEKTCRNVDPVPEPIDFVCEKYTESRARARRRGSLSSYLGSVKSSSRTESRVTITRMRLRESTNPKLLGGTSGASRRDFIHCPCP